MVGSAQTLKMALGGLRLAVISPCALLLEFVQTKKFQLDRLIWIVDIPAHQKIRINATRSVITPCFSLGPQFFPSTFSSIPSWNDFCGEILVYEARNSPLP